MKKKRKTGLFSIRIIFRAMLDSLIKLNPLYQIRRPVMFVVETGSILTTLLYVNSLFAHSAESPVFILVVSLWLWFTVLFANFAESMAEGRGKAQAETLRSSRSDVQAKRLSSPDRNAEITAVVSSKLKKSDHVLVEAGGHHSR